MNRKDISLLSESYKKVQEAYETFEPGWGNSFKPAFEQEEEEEPKNEIFSILADLLDEIEYSETLLDSDIAGVFAKLFYDMARGKVPDVKYAQRTLDNKQKSYRKEEFALRLKQNNDIVRRVKALKPGDTLIVQLHDGSTPVLKRAIYNKHWSENNIVIKVEGENKVRVIGPHEVKEINPKNKVTTNDVLNTIQSPESAALGDE